MTVQVSERVVRAAWMALKRHKNSPAKWREQTPETIDGWRVAIAAAIEAYLDGRDAL